MVIIYALTEPDGTVRYVGKTSRDPRIRFAGHLKEALKLPRRDTHKNHWIRSLVAKGQQPHLMLLACCEGDGDDLERWYIAIFRSLGCRLTNATDGGGGVTGYRHTAETRAKIGATLTGRKRKPHTAEAKAKMSAAMKGRPANPIGVAKRIGRKQSPESRAKKSEALRGRKQSPEAIAKGVAARAGFRHSEETKARISALLSGRKLDPVRIEAAAAAHRGLKRSDETKRKISEGVKANWEVRRSRAS